MPTLTYRFKNPIVVLLIDVNRERLTQLPAGSVFTTSAPTPDCNGMVDGKCDGRIALLFSRDLHERAEPIGER